MSDEPRVLDAVQDLLDLMLSDTEERPSGRVEDLEFDERGERPVLTTLLSGAPALADRLEGRLGAWIRGLYRRLHDAKEAEPIRVGLDQIQNINGRVDLRVSRSDLGIGRLDAWIVDTFVGHIPGADHAPE
ncbi:MAG: hypothetical protein ACJ76P_10705 [Actinomycetota bacterium]